MTYDPDNIFAKILRGEMPCHKVYEDDNTFAFLDIMPRADGHTLVIPKSPSRNLLDAADGDLATLIPIVKKIGQAAMKAFEAPGLLLQQFNEAEAGQIVFHLHFHVLPRHDGVPLRPPGKMADNDLLAGHAEKIRRALAGS
jgi:histidine triad (HIT) family protein